jgi:hypothetical protein
MPEHRRPAQPGFSERGLLPGSRGLERLKAFAHYLQKLADVRPIRIAFKPREARPAEAKTQVIDERQLMGLVSRKRGQPREMEARSRMARRR